VEAVQRYDSIRRPAVRRVQDGAGLLQSLCGLESSLAQHFRDAVLAVGTLAPQLGRTAIRRALLPDVRAVRSATVFDRPNCLPQAGPSDDVMRFSAQQRKRVLTP
jgi:hypothetical protein